MQKFTIWIKSLIIVSLLFFTANLYAQVGLNFQGVARTSNNVILASQAISVRLSILQGSVSGTSEYSETRKVNTNAQGLFTVVIGDTGTINKSGNFSTINWRLSPKFLKIEMDPTGGTNFILLGTTQFQYVAYAQFAKSVDAENIVGVIPVALGGTGVSSIAGLKSSLSLDKVNNTADSSKPISKATKDSLNLKENVSNKSILATLGTSDVLYPSQKAVKTYVDAQISSNSVPDANATTKGRIQLAGDLGGTAASPTVPGLALKANIANPTFTGTVNGITKSMVGLGNVDNTSDSAKPLSAAAKIQLDLKAPLASPTLTGIPTAPTAANGTNTTQLATTAFVLATNATNANLTGDVTSSGNTTTVVKINGVELSNLSTGILKNTTKTGAPTIAEAGVDYLTPTGKATTLTDFPTLNQNTSGNAATATKLADPVKINGVDFDGSSDISISAENLSGTQLNSTITESSLTSLGTVKSLIVSGKAAFGTSTATSTSAILEANSTSQGFLPPRMSYDQKIAISSPTAGLIIWCSNCGASGELQVYNGTNWTNLIGGPASATRPTVGSTTAATSITSTSAVSGGSITSDGGATITERGVCWATTTNPTTSNSKVISVGTTGTFTSNITGLTGATLYYVRAYAINSAGTSYGPQISFTAGSLPPTVASTAAVSNITPTSATSGGNISSDGGAAIIERGVCWSTSTNPTTANSKATATGTTGAFTVNLTGLTGATLYYVRAYATNSAGTSYGAQVSFTTSQVPTVASTSVVTNITATSATSGGNISSDGGAAITERGVCWSTSINPTTANSKATTTGTTGTFTVNLTGLNGATLYYVRAYASNSAGTSYGPQVSFTTTDPNTVVSAGGKTWWNRNLGANQVATSSTDTSAYGDLYQWGRSADGHQLRRSATTTTLSTSDNPGNALFIRTNGDWRNPSNNSLWQGVNGVNNPCPTGFRLPTEAEWNTERLSWSTRNAAGAFASPLKLTVSGHRFNGTGSVDYAGSEGRYWTSTNATFTTGAAMHLSISNYGVSSDGTIGSATMVGWSRGFGLSVRCIKN